MAQYRKQHLLPRLSLENFVDARGHVWTYDKVRGKTWNRIPEETGVISHFYSFVMPDGSLNTSIEQTFGKIEDAAAPVYRKLVSGEALTDDDRFAFGYFLGAMHVRTTTMRRIVAQIHAHGYHMHQVVSVRHKPTFDGLLRRAFGNEVDPELKSHIRDQVEDMSNHSITIPKEYTLGVIAAGDQLANIFSQMSWTVATAAAHYFVTCDNPVNRSVDPATVHPIYGDHGFLNKTAQVTFALSPKKLLLLTHETKSASAIVLPRDYVLKENRKRAFDADSFVYAHLKIAALKGLSLRTRGSDPRLKRKGLMEPRAFARSRYRERQTANSNVSKRSFESPKLRVWIPKHGASHMIYPPSTQGGAARGVGFVILPEWLWR